MIKVCIFCWCELTEVTVDTQPGEVRVGCQESEDQLAMSERTKSGPFNRF